MGAAESEDFWHSLDSLDQLLSDDEVSAPRTPKINKCTAIIPYIGEMKNTCGHLENTCRAIVPYVGKDPKKDIKPEFKQENFEIKKRPIAVRSWAANKRQATGVKVKHEPGCSSRTFPAKVKHEPADQNPAKDRFIHSLNVEPLAEIRGPGFKQEPGKPSFQPGTPEKPMHHIHKPKQEHMQVSDQMYRQRVLNALKTFSELRTTGDSSHAICTAKEMRLKGLWLDRGSPHIGHVPGIVIGDVFRYRAELCIVNLHNQSQAGIAWIKGNSNQWGVPVSNSIVISEGYYANRDESDASFVYLGSGAPNKDQELTRGNLALANSCKHKVPVRVIRADGLNKLFRYDGLYLVTSFWEDKNGAGFRVYKFRMEKSLVEWKFADN